MPWINFKLDVIVHASLQNEQNYSFTTIVFNDNTNNFEIFEILRL